MSSVRAVGREETVWQSDRGEKKSHQAGTVSGILTAVYFKNQNNTAAAEPEGKPNYRTYRQTLEEMKTSSHQHAGSRGANGLGTATNCTTHEADGKIDVPTD